MWQTRTWKAVLQNKWYRLVNWILINCEWLTKKNWEEFQSRYDHISLHLRALLDSPEWEEMITLLNDHVHPTATTIYITKIIPQEAVFV